MTFDKWRCVWLLCGLLGCDLHLPAAPPDMSAVAPPAPRPDLAPPPPDLDRSVTRCDAAMCDCPGAGPYDPAINECVTCNGAGTIAAIGTGRCWRCGPREEFGLRKQVITCCQNADHTISFFCGGEYACCPYENNGRKATCVPRASVMYIDTPNPTTCYVSPLP